MKVPERTCLFFSDSPRIQAASVRNRTRDHRRWRIDGNRLQERRDVVGVLLRERAELRQQQPSWRGKEIGGGVEGNRIA